jgi:hypothetical protein
MEVNLRPRKKSLPFSWQTKNISYNQSFAVHTVQGEHNYVRFIFRIEEEF